MNPNTLSVSTLDMVLDHQELYSPLGDEMRKKVRQTLLKHHHHQNQKKLANRLPFVSSIADMGRRTSELHLDKNGEKTGTTALLDSVKNLVSKCGCFVNVQYVHVFCKHMVLTCVCSHLFFIPDSIHHPPSAHPPATAPVKSTGAALYSTPLAPLLAYT